MAFQVDNLAAAIEGESLLLGPYEPFHGFQVAMIEDNGIPIELIETSLSDDEVFGEPKAQSIIYPEEVVPVGKPTE